MFGNYNGISGEEESSHDFPVLPDPSFTAVLKEIFLQTQSEIQESKVHLNTAVPFHVSVPSSFRLDIPEETQRFEPLVDPAVSFISNILAEEDHQQDRPCMTMNEFVAYQAKANELANLLSEDSPTLRLDVQPDYPLSPDVAFTSFSEDSYTKARWNAQNIDIGKIHPAQDLTNKLNPESTADSGIRSNESRDDLSLRSNLHKAHKFHKQGNLLKLRKESTGTRKKSGARTARIDREDERDCLDINDLLLQSAQAVGSNNVKLAVDVLKKVRKHASPYGSGMQRLAYYFVEALDARFSGTGWPLYLGLLHRRPSAAEVLRAISVFVASCPFSKVSHYFINQTILDVAKGASKLHILDYQIAGGFNYPSLIKALAERPGGPPFVRLVGFGVPHYSVMPARTEQILEGVQKTGRRLSDYAALYGVPFEYIAWAGMREDVVFQEFVPQERDKDEVVVIISAYLLRYVMDDTIDSPSVRLQLLRQCQRISPNVYVQGIVTGAYNTPFFTSRFREALYHFDSLFDALDTFVGRENQDRIVFESEILGKAILNIVACEGTAVVERVDKYKQWQALSEEVGLVQLPLNEEIKQNVGTMLGTWHKEYTLSEDRQYMLMGWKGRMLFALSTWKSAS